MNMKTLLAMATTIAATFVAQAKTIALWPIDHDGTAFDGRNAASSANPLAGEWFVCDGSGLGVAAQP